MAPNPPTRSNVGNSFSVSLKKVRAIPNGTAQNFFQGKPCLFAEVSNRSHTGKTVASLMEPDYHYKTMSWSC